MRTIPLLKKGVAVGIILLFLGTTVNLTTGISNNRDDTIPPVTTISFTPPDPDGQNGWYISNVTVTLNATDNGSGVNITKYSVGGAPWVTYTEPFILTKEGKHLLIEYYSIDTAGNIEPVKNATIDIDRTKPIISSFLYNYTGGNWYSMNLSLYAKTYDDLSDMNRAEFYAYNQSNHDMELRETIMGPGPLYGASIPYPTYYSLHAIGLIRNPEITDEFVKFYARIVLFFGSGPDIDWAEVEVHVFDNAGNWNYAILEEPYNPPNTLGFELFNNMAIPNNYTGHVGKFLICATFCDNWGEIQ